MSALVHQTLEGKKSTYVKKNIRIARTHIQGHGRVKFVIKFLLVFRSSSRILFIKDFNGLCMYE